MAEEIPKTMRAWHVTRNGPPRDCLALSPSVPVPLPLSGTNVLLKVTHVALNPADPHHMLTIPSWVPFRRRPVPGIDFAGVVAAVPPNSALKVGDEVCGAVGFMSISTGKGTLAEYIAVPAEQCVPRPPGLDMGRAAGLCGVAGQTAYYVLKEAGFMGDKGGEGKRLLVNGASGGVGCLMVQAARALGAEVVGVCSAKNEAFVKRMGATEVRIRSFNMAKTALTSL
jgi:NADPH:quinone reductase-like Zn-dependent oxidoreductase